MLLSQPGVTEEGHKALQACIIHCSLLSSLLQVSPGSSITASELMAPAKETHFPQTPRDLLKWARREFGGVTSLAEYHGVNTVYIRLGAGRVFRVEANSRKGVAIRVTCYHWGGE